MKRFTSLFLVCGILLFLLCGCGEVQLQEDPILVEKYTNAVELMEKETTSTAGEFYKYDDARKIFIELGDFRDSKEKAEECYQKSIPLAIKIGEEYINDGDIWGAKNLLPYWYKDNMPKEISDFLEQDIFNLIGDWSVNMKQGTSLRLDLSSSSGTMDIVAVNGSSYNSGYWKIKNNKLYFCGILKDKDDDSNYKEVFTIVSYTKDTLTIKNSQQSFTLTK